MRTCTNCGKKMAEGYLLEEMGDTFCSDFCLDIAYPGSSIEMANMTDEQLEDSTWYWTSWEEDDTDEDEDESADITCPYCGHENSSAKDYLDLESEVDCQDCDKRFGYSVTITYTTFKVEDDESSNMEISYEDIVRAAEDVAEDEGALQQVSFEDAKAAFTDDQRVYLVSQVFYKKATHLDDIINHFNFDGMFLIRQDYANDFNMGR